MARWIGGIIMASILLAFVGGICELTYMSTLATTKGSVTYVSHIQQMLTMPNYEKEGLVGGVQATISLLSTWVNGLWDFLWWNYPFFTGAWLIVKWVFFMPISAAIVIGTFALMRGTDA